MSYSDSEEQVIHRLGDSLALQIVKDIGRNLIGKLSLDATLVGMGVRRWLQ